MERKFQCTNKMDMHITHFSLLNFLRTATIFLSHYFFATFVKNRSSFVCNILGNRMTSENSKLWRARGKFKSKNRPYS